MCLLKITKEPLFLSRQAERFGTILSLTGCMKGFYTTGGAEGVGRATTEAVVMSSLVILLSDFFLTKLLF